MRRFDAIGWALEGRVEYWGDNNGGLRNQIRMESKSGKQTFLADNSFVVECSVFEELPERCKEIDNT